MWRVTTTLVLAQKSRFALCVEIDGMGGRADIAVLSLLMLVLTLAVRDNRATACQNEPS